ncbi:helix-turn-helix domain-containing protein [Candidatus Symbiothrix dinenymphae]|uniref:helix-turn-helix domain-containing protein n=1 Tax=Candidatus Symbiothrix dinenymphae TaxID=467085 RepID=UPI0006C16648|nr:winged helix-turn-helix domain-containing protein [Candidatus Symbiothrix dinenymphae]GAP72644.1 transcriptional regulatory protein rprY [Candidatus Symbiothrix dinenymphae]
MESLTIVREAFCKVKDVVFHDSIMLDDSLIQIGQYVLNEQRNTLKFAHRKTQHLSPRECDILGVLWRDVERLVSREALLAAYWQSCSVYASRSLDLFIHRLRKQLAADPKVKILTIRNKGFLLTVDYQQE